MHIAHDFEIPVGGEQAGTSHMQSVAEIMTLHRHEASLTRASLQPVDPHRGGLNAQCRRGSGNGSKREMEPHPISCAPTLKS